MNKVSCVDMILLCETVEILWNLEILNHDECWYYHDALLPVAFLHVGWHFFKDLFRHQKHHHSIKKMKNTKTLMVVPFRLLFTLQETRELYQAPMTFFLGGGKIKNVGPTFLLELCCPSTIRFLWYFVRRTQPWSEKKIPWKKLGVFLLGVNCRVARAWIFNCENAICWAMGMKHIWEWKNVTNSRKAFRNCVKLYVCVFWWG